MRLNSIGKKEYHPYYKTYLDKSNAEGGIVEGLSQNSEIVASFFSDIPKEKHSYAYAAGKWTIKDVLLHIIDTERIFAYRALRIARRDKIPMVGFEQDSYVEHGFAETRTIENLVNEYKTVRQATISLFSNFSSETLLEIGEASGAPFSVRVLGLITIGHENHHIEIIRDRYL
ncbi:DinB family protein [Winogradskyella bathintestinalis]|uniref:DinB family protein n=1 Tax=Winogradskyella bathintestinalis TaxID=3035208 RepID=A0ABT7ZXK7_9FLAO|nr:DinB family protein [Winogradskyella bathintestinalis]MDN3493726.1 DinB family protein [Winogradskyella bathintestinalis]